MFRLMGLTCVLLAMTGGLALASSIEIVRDGNPVAVIVTADEPTPIATYAAEELRSHIARATGAELPVSTESRQLPADVTRIYVGVTQAASSQGIDVDALELEAAILRSVERDIYVLGRESVEGDPLSEANQFSGTLFGVYELLERFVGVRWLWPGDLGTVVPATDNLRFESVDEVIQPALEFREFRWSVARQAMRRVPKALQPLSFSDEGARKFGQALNVYLRRHRMGTRLNPEQYVNHGRTGHAMSRWWQNYGQENPHLFMMDEKGQRGHYDPKSVRVDPCMSNPELHRFIVEHIWDGGNVLRLGAKDHHNYCHCENCLAWDEPVPNDPFVVNHRVISNRYARFYKAVYDLAVERNPNVEVTAYVYMNYFPAPDPSITLNENIYLEYVPWGCGSTHWLPTTQERMDWLKEQWLGWVRTGAKMGYRPNWELGGHAMPHTHTRQGAEFIQFAAQHGNTVLTLSNMAQYGVRGFEHYMWARLITKPDLTVEQIRREYFDAFGPAASDVERYCDYWEQHNQDLFDQNQWASMWSNPAAAPRQFPPESFDRGEAILHQALQAAQSGGTQEHVERVEFLLAGLQHARLSAHAIDQLLGFVNDASKADEARRAMHELAAFRREKEHMFISNYLRPLRVARRPYGPQIDLLLSGKPINQEQQFHDWGAVSVPAYLTRTEVGGYLGYGWYRTTFSFGANDASLPVKLSFGGVDKQAWVYVNGQLVREHTVKSENLPASQLYNRPFTAEIDPRILSAGDNVLVVRFHSDDGDSGIHRPVRLHVGDQVTELSGGWQFRKDPDNEGLAQFWHITVPGED